MNEEFNIKDIVTENKILAKAKIHTKLEAKQNYYTRKLESPPSLYSSSTSSDGS